jgi:hypothetical protein
MRSPVYWHPAVYHLIMKLLYGKFFRARYEAIAKLIPESATIVEVCAGDGYLYQNYLSKKNIHYTGLELNPAFVNAARKRRFPFHLSNLITDEVPSADYVIIQASLYQFIPDEHRIIRKLLHAANKTLIIAEPIRNLSDSSNSFVKFLAKYSANPGDTHATKRFNRSTLLECFSHYPEFKKSFEIEGGREMVGIFQK